MQQSLPMEELLSVQQPVLMLQVNVPVAALQLTQPVRMGSSSVCAALC